MCLCVPGHMTDLLFTEKDLVTSLKDYIRAEESKLEQIKKWETFCRSVLRWGQAAHCYGDGRWDVETWLIKCWIRPIRALIFTRCPISQFHLLQQMQRCVIWAFENESEDVPAESVTENTKVLVCFDGSCFNTDTGASSCFSQYVQMLKQYFVEGESDSATDFFVSCSSWYQIDVVFLSGEKLFSLPGWN